MFLSKAVATTSRAAKVARIARAARRAAGGSDESRAHAKRVLASLMADARGVPMKIGQFLADTPDGQAFADLVDGIPPRPLSEMLPVLEQGLARPVSEVFASIDESQAAASLGQVHHATLLDGTEVAVKLRYPDIQDAVNAEMRLAGWLPGVGPVKKWGFDLTGYKSTLKHNMDRELDYRDEAERQQRFNQAVQVPGLVVPAVYRPLCSPGVLVQSWETGQRLHNAQGWSLSERQAIGKTLLANCFASLFIAGEVHGDPHTGNMLLRRNPAGSPQVVLLDYGCTVPVSQQARLSLLKLIVGCRDRDATDPLRSLAGVGFDAAKLLSIAKPLPALCRLLFEPFCQDEPFSTQYWDLSRRSDTLLGDLRWWFRSAGPPGLILLMRAFRGVVSHLETLKITLPWWRTLIETVGSQALDRARAFSPDPLPTGLAHHDRMCSSVAQHLKIRVVEGSRQVVAVTMPASQVPFLKDQIPEDVLRKLDHSGINIDTIVRDACDQGIIPGDLFTLRSGARDYRVWLE